MDFRLVSPDGTVLSATHEPARGGPSGLAFVVIPGFSGSWEHARVRQVCAELARFGGVVAVDLRGHGRSEGATTLGKDEPLDASTAVRWARERYDRVVLVGFSMGAAVALRATALYGRVDAVVAVSGPAFWYYRGTRVMRRLHWAIERPVGRWAIRTFMGTRVTSRRWPESPPLAPVEAAARLGGTPLLVVHGDQDDFFPLDHPEAIVRAAQAAQSTGVDLIIEPGFGHAEGSISRNLVRRIAEWAIAVLDFGTGPETIDEP